MSKHEIRDLEKQLLAELSNPVSELGFNKKPVNQSFYKPTDFGRLAFHVSFIEHDDDFDITADVAIRVDALEDLVNELNKQLTKAEKKQTFSIGAELGNIAAGKQKRWKVCASTDIPMVAGSIARELERVGLPYLEEYSKFSRMFEILSSNEPPSWIHSPIHGARCQRAVGLAIVMGKVDSELESLIERNEVFLRGRNDFGLPGFLQFARAVRQKK
jgi:hypothetical protein